MKIKKQREAILKGNMYRVIISLSLPIMLNNLIQTVYNFTDAYFVSRIGGTQVAALTFVWPIIFLVLAFGMGIGIAGTAMISQYIGGDNMDSAEETAGQILSFSLIISLVLGIIGYLASPYIIKLMGASGELFSESNNYLKIIFMCSPFIFMTFSYSSIKNAEGDTFSPMIISLISVVINIILDPIFIFVFDLGIIGAGYATLLARMISTIIIIFKLFKRNQGIKIKIKNLYLTSSIIKEIVKIGLPASMGHSITAFGFVILNMLVVKFGTDTLAALGIGNRINSVLFMPAMGIGNAVTSIAGQNIGANNYSRVKETVIKSSILSLVYSIIGTGTLILTKTSIARFFTDNPVILSKSTHYLLFVALSVPFMGIFWILLGLFQGSGHTVLSMTLSLSRLWAIRLPGIFILSRFFSMSEEAIWYSIFFSNVIISFVAVIIYFTGSWKKSVIKIAKSETNV